jgi:hypothetical protein
MECLYRLLSLLGKDCPQRKEFLKFFVDFKISVERNYAAAQ